MASKTWNGTDGAFATDAGWTPTGTPTTGDIAIINAGTVTRIGTSAAGVTIRLNASAGSSPVLVLRAATVQAGDSIVVNGTSSTATLSVVGLSVNAGNITLTADNPVIAFDTPSTTALTNRGGISVIGTTSIISNFGAGTLTNNGVISYRAAPGSIQTDTIFGSVTGNGAIRLSGAVALSVNATITAGQTVVFEKGAATVALNNFGNFGATFAGFSSNDDITGIGLRWTNVAFQPTGSGGYLNFSSSTQRVAQIAFVGAYTSLANFTVTQDGGTGGQSTTDIRTNVAEPEARINVINQTTGIAITEPGDVYVGPVTYLQYQYIYNGPDPVVLGANVDNVFLKGSSGGDAIQVRGGNNVIDGGGGSNFLVGSTGADGGSDTFFIDETSNVETWSTLVNFHVGDAATIFGFKQGISTLPITASDGAAGYQGVTIHSEIKGAGTGVTGSVTFTGLTLADFGRFTLSYGRTPDNQDYLLIQRFS